MGAQDVSISVNVSVVQFLHDDLPSIIENIIDEMQIPSGSLCIEVTESVFESHPEKLSDQINRIKAMGVRLSLDDFGTGCSSLSHLHDYPFYEIKVDKTFVGESINQLYSMEIIRMIMRISEVLDIDVVAEGIETAEHRRLLRKLGCCVGQGYYYSHPLCEADFQSLLLNSLRLPYIEAYPSAN